MRNAATTRRLRHRAAALATAAKIGAVSVDMGDTSCKVPDAAAYIPLAGGVAVVAALAWRALRGERGPLLLVLAIGAFARASERSWVRLAWAGAAVALTPAAWLSGFELPAVVLLLAQVKSRSRIAAYFSWMSCRSSIGASLRRCASHWRLATFPSFELRPQLTIPRDSS